MQTSRIQVAGLARGKLNMLRAQARDAGTTAELYAKRLIEEGILLQREARSRTFDELYEPAQERFRRRDMTEEELDQIVDAARTRHHRRSTRKRR